MGRACAPIRGKSRMRAYPWTVAHACLSVDSRACVPIRGKSCMYATHL